MYYFYLFLCCVAGYLFDRFYIFKWIHKKTIIGSMFAGLVLGYISYFYKEEWLLKYLFFIFYIVLRGIFIIDAKLMRIPNMLTSIVFLCGVTICLYMYPINILNHIFGMVFICFFLLLLLKIKPGCFGLGDVKLCGAAGLFLGLGNILCAFVIAVLLAGIIGICVLVKNQKLVNQKIPFGPFLCLGMIIASFYGDTLVNWYFSFY